MGEESKKIGMTLVIGLIILVISLIVAIVWSLKYYIDREKAKDVILANEEQNKIVTQTPETPDITKTPTVQPKPVTDATTNFTFAFLKMESNKQNMIYSPLSIKYALKMLEEGAEGNTYTQIHNVIGDLNLPKYENIENILSLANSMYVRDRYYPKVKQTYIDTLKTKYEAEVMQDEFKDATNVNKWIENKTFGILKDVVEDATVQDPFCSILLINALAIDMEWENAFSDDDTHGKTFYKADGTEMIATTLSKETSSDDIAYYKGNNVTALSMDLKEYGNNKFEFLAIMPDSNLDQYVNNVTEKQINEIVQNMKKASDEQYGLSINIPKFHFAYSLKLQEDLEKLGITDVFSSVISNLTKMANLTPDERLYVSKAIHKADIEFTEKGTKAAAVTVFAVYTTGFADNPGEPIEINIDKPFLFVIRDKNTGEIWFVGTVYEPNSWADDKEDYQPQYY